jgi:hypothetical protein
VKPTAAGKADRARLFALENFWLATPRSSRTRHGRHIEQGACIRMQQLAPEGLARGALHDPTKIHDDDPVRDVLDDCEIMRDEEILNVQAIAKIGQNIDHLRSHGHVERRHRLVADDEFRARRKRSRNAYVLPLAARKLVGYRSTLSGGRPT